MARPIAESLKYFPLDVDFFDDPKILFVADKFGDKGELIIIKLLCKIYRNGYFLKWDNDYALVFARKYFSSTKSTLCQEVVQELLKRGFFDETIFKSFNVLTSAAIQDRWQRIIVSSKRKATIRSEFCLLTKKEETPVNGGRNPSLLGTNPRKPNIKYTKEKKGKEKKEKERDIYIPADFSNSQHSDSEEPLRAPPTKGEFMNYCTLHGFNPQYAEHLFDTCSAHGWLAQKTRAPIADWKAYARSRFKWQPGFLASLNQKNGFKSNKPQKPPSKFDSAEAFLEGIEIN